MLDAIVFSAANVLRGRHHPRIPSLPGRNAYWAGALVACWALLAGYGFTVAFFVGLGFLCWALPGWGVFLPVGTRPDTAQERQEDPDPIERFIAEHLVKSRNKPEGVDEQLGWFWRMLLLTPAFVPVIQSDGLVGFILLTMGWAFFATTAHTGIIWVGLKMKRDTLLLSEATLGMLMGLLIFGAYGGGK